MNRPRIWREGGSEKIKVKREKRTRGVTFFDRFARQNTSTIHFSLFTFAGGGKNLLPSGGTCGKVAHVLIGKITETRPQRAGVGGWKPLREDARLVRPGAPANLRRVGPVKSPEERDPVRIERGWYRGSDGFRPGCGTEAVFLYQDLSLRGGRSPTRQSVFPREKTDSHGRRAHRPRNDRTSKEICI